MSSFEHGECHSGAYRPVVTSFGPPTGVARLVLALCRWLFDAPPKENRRDFPPPA